MTTQQERDRPDGRATLPLVQIAIALSFVVAFLFHFSFWSTFDVDILQFVSLGDLPRLAAWPLFLALCALVVGIAIGVSTEWDDKREPRVSGLPPLAALRLHVNRHPTEAFWVVLFSGMLLKSLLSGHPFRWPLMAFLFAFLVIRWLAKRKNMITPKGVSARTMGSMVVFLVISFCLAVGLGKFKAELIYRGMDYVCVRLGPNAQNLTGLTAVGDLRLLANTGGYTLLLNGADLSVIVLGNSLIPDYRLTRVKFNDHFDLLWTDERAKSSVCSTNGAEPETSVSPKRYF